MTHHHRSHRHEQSVTQGKPDSCWWEKPSGKNLQMTASFGRSFQEKHVSITFKYLGVICGMNDRASRTSFKTKKTIKCVAMELSGEKQSDRTLFIRAGGPHVRLYYTTLCCVGPMTPRINQRKTFEGFILSCATCELWSWAIHFIPWALSFPKLCSVSSAF